MLSVKLNSPKSRPRGTLALGRMILQSLKIIDRSKRMVSKDYRRMLLLAPIHLELVVVTRGPRPEV